MAIEIRGWRADATQSGCWDVVPQSNTNVRNVGRELTALTAEGFPPALPLQR